MTTESDFDIRDLMREQQAYNARRFRRMLGDALTPIAMCDTFTVDEYGQMTIGRWGGYDVQILPMLFNDRLVLCRPGSYGYDHGWCYDKGGAAFLAAMVWNPETEGEPAGYKKRATPGLRKPGETAADCNDADIYGALLYGLLAELLEDKAQ